MKRGSGMLSIWRMSQYLLSCSMTRRQGQKYFVRMKIMSFLNCILLSTTLYSIQKINVTYVFFLYSMIAAEPPFHRPPFRRFAPAFSHNKQRGPVFGFVLALPCRWLHNFNLYSWFWGESPLLYRPCCRCDFESLYASFFPNYERLYPCHRRVDWSALFLLYRAYILFKHHYGVGQRVLLSWNGNLTGKRED